MSVQTVARSSLMANLSLLFALVGCAGGEMEYAMGDWISMGPFTFAVTRATDQLSPATPGRPGHRVIRVSLELDPDRSEPTKLKFDDFLNDMTDNRMVVFPALKLVDSDGNEFDGLVARASGRTRWRADFETIIIPRGMRDAEFRSDIRVQDVVLRIKNLDRRSGQPANAVIRLH